MQHIDNIIKENENLIKLIIAKFPEQFANATYYKHQVVIDIKNLDMAKRDELDVLLDKLFVKLRISGFWDKCRDYEASTIAIGIVQSNVETKEEKIYFDLIKSFDYWLKHHTAFTAGAAAGLFVDKVPRDVGKLIGSLLDRKDAGHIALVRTAANKSAKTESAKVEASHVFFPKISLRIPYSQAAMVEKVRQDIHDLIPKESRANLLKACSQEIENRNWLYLSNDEIYVLLNQLINSIPRNCEGLNAAKQDLSDRMNESEGTVQQFFLNDYLASEMLVAALIIGRHQNNEVLTNNALDLIANMMLKLNTTIMDNMQHLLGETADHLPAPGK